MLNEDKLKELAPLTKKDNIIRGKEWNALAYVIKTYFIEREDYKKASTQKNTLEKHMVQMLDQLDFLSYIEIKKIVHKLFSVLLGEKLISASMSGISIEKNQSNINSFFYQGKEVEVCWIPTIDSDKTQALVTYQEYAQLSGKIKYESTSTTKKKYLKARFTFEDVIRKAFILDASDVQITYSGNEYYTLFEIAGSLVNQTEFILEGRAGREFVENIKLQAALFTKGKFKADTHLIAQDARMEFDNIGMEGLDIRLEFIPDGRLNNTCLTARLIKRDKITEPNFDGLGYGDDIISVIKKVSKRQNGLVVSSGITGSGKSMLISSMVIGIDDRKRIYSVEDPIERKIEFPHITQHQVFVPDKKEDKMGFLEYAKAFKRGAPHVVFIGEMRKEPELIQTLIEMSEAGQLVLTTVHITSAFGIYGSFEKIFDIPLSVSIPLVLFSVNQVLVNKLCQDCKIVDEHKENAKKLKEIKRELPYKHKDALDNFLDDDAVITYKKGAGCEKCGKKGYKGRVPVYEYFYPDVEFIEWLNEREKAPSKLAIEQRACETKIGKNKLQTYISLLTRGIVDTSDDVLYKIM